jgi:hypothetical protein
LGGRSFAWTWSFTVFSHFCVFCPLQYEPMDQWHWGAQVAQSSRSLIPWYQLGRGCSLCGCKKSRDEGGAQRNGGSTVLIPLFPCTHPDGSPSYINGQCLCSYEWLMSSLWGAYAEHLGTRMCIHIVPQNTNTHRHKRTQTHTHAHTHKHNLTHTQTHKNTQHHIKPHKTT